MVLTISRQVTNQIFNGNETNFFKAQIPLKMLVLNVYENCGRPSCAPANCSRPLSGGALEICSSQNVS